MRKNTVDQFWTKVIKTDTCWLWTASKNRKGYGQFRWHGTPWIAHRFSWTVHHGVIPNKLFVLHECDTPACVRPSHLHLGTAADNVKERCERNRSHYLTGEDHWSHKKPEHLTYHGERHWSAKLSSNQIFEIRERYSNGDCTQRFLAREYGVSQPMIGNIVRREKWKHVA